MESAIDQAKVKLDTGQVARWSFLTVPYLVERGGLDPEKTAIVFEDRRRSYGELRERARRIGNGLIARGIEPMDRVAVLARNCVEFIEIEVGIASARAIMVPLNWRLQKDELRNLLRRSEARAIFVEDEYAPIIAELREAGDLPEMALAIVLGDGAGELEYEEFCSSSSAERPERQGRLEDPHEIIYTSGTTGEPKGVTLTHRNMTFVGESIIESLGMYSEDRVLCVLPLSFGYGLFQLLMCVRLGATIVLEAGFAFAGKLVEVLERERITILPGVPSIFAVLTSLQGLADRDLPHLRLLTNAGAGLPEPARAELRATFPGAGLHSMYGLTECLRVCTLPPEEQDRKPGSVGKPIPGTEAWVADDEGQPLPPGEIGELLVRGGHVMQGYWRDLEATGLKLRPGHWPWERILATGDLFRADEEGYLYVEGRRDDQIKSRGEKVMPREVEDALLSHDAVHEAAVVGVPDRLLGQAIHAHVVLAAGAEAKPPELRRHCAERLEVHKVPRQVVIRDALPRTINGKLDRKALAAEAG